MEEINQKCYSCRRKLSMSFFTRFNKQFKICNNCFRKCLNESCNKSAVGRTDYCKAHGGGKRCIESDCSKSAVGRTDYCVTHGGGKRCIESGCSKSARGKSDYCVSHGGGKRCIESGCNASAQGKTDYCKAHGGGKRCIESGCSKSAQGKTDYCISHGGGKRCIESGCNASAQGKTDYCVSHGGGKRCIESGCNASAVGKTDYCISHGGGQRCPNCIGWPDSRSGNKKYDGYCATCFKNLFPTDKRSAVIYQKSHEMKARNYLFENYGPDGFIHDRPIWTGNCDCTHRRRIDFRALIDGTILAVEVDERQHKYYEQQDEEIRYNDLFMIHSSKWIFIRFNPDSYMNKNKRINTNMDTRLVKLKEEIDNQIDRIKNNENEELVEIIKMYYDKN